MSDDYFMGQLTADPLIDAQKGDEIWFEARYFQLVGPLMSQHVKHLSEFDGVVLGLAFKLGNKIEVTGTGVIIAPGMAVCAKHVIDGYVQRITSDDVSIYAIGVRSDGLEIWKVEKIRTIDQNDVAILSLSLASPVRGSRPFNVAHITARVPFKGERISVVGFRAASSEFEIAESLPWEIELALIASKGEVSEIFRTGRDRVMLPGPSFSLECSTWGGMSGGPAFDLNGNLIGLLTSSYGDDPISFVSLLWPALCIDVCQVWPMMDKPFFGPLIENMHCPILGRELVSYKLENGVLTASNSS